MKIFIFIFLFFVVATSALAVIAPWQKDDFIACESPVHHQRRLNFTTTVIEPVRVLNGIEYASSLMKIEGDIIEDGKIIHQFDSTETYWGIHPETNGTKTNVFFSEGWPQVTYFIGRFDSSTGNSINNGSAIFYPTGSFQYQDLKCQLSISKP